LRREGRTAAAGARGVRIDKVEPLPHECLFVVERHAVQIDKRLGIDKDAHAIELVNAVAFARMRVELDRIGQPRAAAPHHAQPKATFFGRNAFLGHGGTDLLDRALRHLDARARSRRRKRLRRRGRSAFAWLAFNTDEVRHNLPFKTSYFAALAAWAVSATPFFFFQSPMAARIASSASTEQ